MKKVILLGAFVIAFAVQAQDNTVFKNDAIELIKITGVDAAFEDAIAQIGVKVTDEKKEAYVKEAKGTLGVLYSSMANLYMKEFTHPEIKELLVFYSTDLGKKLSLKQTVIGQKSISIGQHWGFDVQGIAQKYSSENVTPEKSDEQK